MPVRHSTRPGGNGPEKLAAQRGGILVKTDTLCVRVHRLHAGAARPPSFACAEIGTIASPPAMNGLQGMQHQVRLGGRDPARIGDSGRLARRLHYAMRRLAGWIHHTCGGGSLSDVACDVKVEM